MKNRDIIRDARVTLGLRLSQLAELAQVSLTKLAGIERGAREPDPDDLGRIYQALTAVVARRRPLPPTLPLEPEQLAERAYEVYCGAFLQQGTLRPKHPGQMPLAAWHEQREEVRACWLAVVRHLTSEPARCGREIEVERPDGVYRTHCVLPEGHGERAAARGELSPCGAFFVVPPESTIK